MVELNVEHFGGIVAYGPETRIVMDLQRNEAGTDRTLADHASCAMLPIDADDAQTLVGKTDEKAVVELPQQSTALVEHHGRKVGEKEVRPVVGPDDHNVGVPGDGLHVHDVVVLEAAGVGSGKDLQVAMAIESVETTFGTNPHVAIGTLAQGVYLTTGEIGLDSQEVGCGQVMISIGRCEVANRLDGDKGEKKQEAIDDAAWSELAHQFFGMCSHKTGQC